MRCEAKAVTADHHPTVKDAPRAHHAVEPNHHLRGKAGVRTDAGTLPHVALSPDDRAVSDDGTGIHHSERTDAHPITDDGLGRHHRTGMDACRGPRPHLSPPPTRQRGEISVGVVRDDASRQPSRIVHHHRTQDDARSLRACELAAVLRIGKEGQRAGQRRFQWANARDRRGGITTQLGRQASMSWFCQGRNHLPQCDAQRRGMGRDGMCMSEGHRRITCQIRHSSP